MRFWLGKTRSPAIIAFQGPTLLRTDGGRERTQFTSWPIRRLYGLAIGRTLITIARCDGPRLDRMEPR